MPYENIPGVGAQYIDGAFIDITTSDQPRVMILGTAESGTSYSIFQVTDVQDAENEFGSSSEVMKGVHEALAQGADNIAIMRIGGRIGEFTITDNAQDGGSLVIRTERRDNDALQRLKLIGEIVDGEQRIVIYDAEREIFLYDSTEELVLDTGLVEVIDGGIANFTCGDLANIDDDDASPRLTDLENADVLALVVTLEVTRAPSDGQDMTNMERYAALCDAYQFLDYQDADMLVPMNAYVDVPNEADEDTDLDFTDGNAAIIVGNTDPALGAVDGLGLCWKTDFRGKPYVFFFDDADALPLGNPPGFIDVVHPATSYRVSALSFRNGPVLVQHADTGDGGPVPLPPVSNSADDGNGVLIFVDGAGAPIVNPLLDGQQAGGPFRVLVDGNGAPIFDGDGDLQILFVGTDDVPLAAIGGGPAADVDEHIANESAEDLALVEIVPNGFAPNVPNAAPSFDVAEANGETTITINYSFEEHTLAEILAVLDGDAAASALIDIEDIHDDGSAGAIPNAAAADQLPRRVSLVVVTHEELTGDPIPDPVWAKLDVGEAAEIREVNFGHQLASACERASVTWSTMLGFVSVTEPSSYSRAAIAQWVGEEPDYSFAGSDLVIADQASEGEGLLGLKLHSGAYDYRSGQVSAATVDEGLAFGGYIKTNGASLASNEPYGISDDDEALDALGRPVDLGKHILVSATWPIVSNGFDGGSQYRAPLCATMAGKLAVTPDKEEPIGLGGLLLSVRRPPRMRMPLVNSLAKLRFVTTRREEGFGHIIVSCRTAAHPSSDYSKLSTIRTVNRTISGLRDICKNYIGKEFSAPMLAQMQATMDGYLNTEKEMGFNQGAVASINFSQRDKIMGRLTIKLKMIPPFAIEAITIETTLAADESDL